MDPITLNWLWFWLTFGALAYPMVRWFRLRPGDGNRRGDESRPRTPMGDGDFRAVPGLLPGRPLEGFDPVSGKPLRLNEALAYFHRGKVYFFASEHTRVRFAAARRSFVPEPTPQTCHSIEAGQRRQPNTFGPVTVGSSSTMLRVMRAQVASES